MTKRPFELDESEFVSGKLTPSRREEWTIYLMVAVIGLAAVIAGYMLWAKVN